MLANWPSAGARVRVLTEFNTPQGRVSRGSVAIVVRAFAERGAPERPMDRFLVKVGEIEFEARRVELADFNAP